MIIAYKTADIEDSFVKGFIRYADLERELKELEEKKRNGTFRPAYRLRQLYERGIQKRVHDPESYAVKNWIVNAQGFCLTVRQKDLWRITMRSCRESSVRICFTEQTGKN